MNPSSSILPSSSWLVATVVPWQTAVTSAPVAPSRRRTLCRPLMNPSAGLAGVEGVLVVTRAPESWSNATTSVNVPPVSIPIRMRRGEVAFNGVKGELVKGCPRRKSGRGRR